MQENKVQNLTTDEIRSMLLATINNSAYEAKCLIDLIITMRDNNKEEINILQEAKKLLNELKTKEAAQLVMNRL